MVARSESNRKDLTAGWNLLYELQKASFEEKVEKSEALVRCVLGESATPVVCWSGGKDSTVVMHMVKRFIPDIPVLYVKTGVEFEESLHYIEAQANGLRLNLTTAENSEDFWNIGREYGWPIFGKAIAQAVSRARRTGNLRAAMSPFERVLVEEGIHISSRCAEILNEKKSKEIEERLDVDLKFIGFRADESRLRTRLWVDYGEYFYVKRYYGRGRGVWKCSPIATWTNSDVYKYFEKYKIKICSLYEMGYPRNGCWPCAMAIKGGQLARLKKYHPVLYERLMNKTEMGDELMRIKKIFTMPKYKRIINSAFNIISEL